MRKIYILYIATISIISLIYINNTSALDYSSNVGIGFTFNPTLSVSLSSSDLVIPNLIPGNTLDSNSINVSVVTNATYGYMLSATVGDNTHDNSNLTHSNNTNVFSSIATDADLPSLTTDNTWGYNTSLDSGSTWSNYNGLSNSSNTTLLDKDSNISSSIDFRIGAKASPVQPSGTYTNTITFTAVTKPTPITLSEAYASEGKTMINGYYTMQDMTSTIYDKTEAIRAQLQVLDIRDYKLYWISKLADNHCWMTQNLDLDLDSNRTYTHWDTDLGWNDSDNLDINANWKPDRSTIDFTIGSTISGWQNSNTEPYSANPGDIYFYTSNSDTNDIQYNSLQECTNAGHNDCTHYHAGNYYNWSAAVASNNTSDIASEIALDSICPMSWKLPDGLYNVLSYSGIMSGGNTYSNNGFNNIRINPLYFSRSGFINQGGSILDTGYEGRYWYSRCSSLNYSRSLIFGATRILASDNNRRYNGYSVRCVAR